MNQKLTYIFLFLTLMLLWMCGQNERSTSLDDGGESSASDEIVYQELTFEERRLKLAECASCHPEEHHNEMIGPHSQSYIKLLEHMVMADTSVYYPRPYKAFLIDNFEDACVSCHTGRNLYETNFIGLDAIAEASKVNEKSHPQAWQIPIPRTGEESRMTGVDCLTCHQKGDQVITTADFIRNPKVEAPCNPIASAFFSSNKNCVSCHKVTYDGMRNNINDPSLVATLSCNGCHMEKVADNKRTHYYYWRHDSKEKQQFPLMRGVFDDIQLAEKSSGSFEFVWSNKRTPHRFSECAEVYAELVFYDSKGVVCARRTMRLNNKSSHDSALKPYFGDTLIWGELGCSFLPDKNECSELIVVDCAKVSRVEIHGFEKPQYWISDKLAHKIYQKTIKL